MQLKVMQDGVRSLTSVLFIIVLLGISPVIAAPKTDVLLLKDGSRLIGENPSVVDSLLSVLALRARSWSSGTWLPRSSAIRRFAWKLTQAHSMLGLS